MCGERMELYQRVMTRESWRLKIRVSKDIKVASINNNLILPGNQLYSCINIDMQKKNMHKNIKS